MTHVLYIGGAGRSGSTLLERIVARLSGVAALGEVTHLWNRGVKENQRCGCGQPFLRCQVWDSIGYAAFKGWAAVDIEAMENTRRTWDRARRIPWLTIGTDDDAVAAYAQRYGELYEAAARQLDCRWVIDSSKHVSLPFLLRYNKSLNVRVVHLVRDPRGVAYSWSKQVQRPEITDRVQLMPEYRKDQVTRTWYVHNAGFHVLSRTHVPVLRVRYEDLLSAPVATVRRIAQFMGLQADVEILDQLARGGVLLGVDHTAAGNPMRFRTGWTDLAPDVEWRHAMPRREQRLLGVVTAPLATAYRYPISPSHRR